MIRRLIHFSQKVNPLKKKMIKRYRMTQMIQAIQRIQKGEMIKNHFECLSIQNSKFQLFSQLKITFYFEFYN